MSNCLFHCPPLHLKCLQLEGNVWEAAYQRCLGCEWRREESDPGIGCRRWCNPGSGSLCQSSRILCDKTVLSVCVDAGLHKVLVRYANPVLVVDTVDECLSKMSVVEERLEWEIIFSSFDGCKITLNDWKNSPSSVDTGCGGYQGTNK